MQRIKNLVILGARESGVGAALLGRQQGWKVFVSDCKLIPSKFEKQLRDADIEYEEGLHSTARILTADCIVKSPGISEKADIIKLIREVGIEVCSEIEFGFRYKGQGKIIAITGSNGKSTVASLTYHILKSASFNVSMVGNIGKSFAKQVYEQPTEWYVIEVSSFQLDDTQSFKPNISVLLNISPDHLDRYYHKFEKYIISKFRIAQNQDSQDCFIVNVDDGVIVNYLDIHFLSVRKIYFTMNELNPTNIGAFVKEDEIHFRFDGENSHIALSELTLQGKHNQYNSMAAGISARIAGIRKEKIRESFTTFEGLEHRLEHVATIRGIEFINDSKATNLNSVWYALESMKQPTILILGGQDKGNDYTQIIELIRNKVKAIVTMGIDAKPIHEAFGKIICPIIDVKSAQEAVKVAYGLAKSGDIVLLSPGCASFDLFKNFEDRGKQFKEAVKAL